MGKSLYADGMSGGRLLTQTYIPNASAGDATKEWGIFCAPADCKVLQVQIVPQATITGQASNYFNLNLIDKGAAGSGSDELGNIDFSSSGVVATNFDGKDIVADTAIASATALTQGDVLALERELVSSGLAMPELIVIVTYVLT